PGSATGSPAPAGWRKDASNARIALKRGSRGPAGPQLFVDRQQAIQVARQAEPLPGPLSSAAPQLLPEGGEVHQRAQGEAQLAVELARVQNQARALERLAVAAHVGRHGGDPAGHGLE